MQRILRIMVTRVRDGEWGCMLHIKTTAALVRLTHRESLGTCSGTDGELGVP